MKILLINDYLNGGGAEKIFKETYYLLKEKNFNVHMFYIYENYKKSDNPFDYIYSIKYNKLLYNKLIDINPDIIHIHGYYHIMSPSILSSIKKYKQNKTIKVIYTCHDFHLLAPNSGFFKFDKNNNPILLENIPSFTEILFSKWDNRSYMYSFLKQLQWIISYKILKLEKVFDILISPSNFLKNFLEKKDTFKGKVKLLYNPLDLNFEEKAKRDNIPILIFAGRLSYEKGLINFIEALKDINENYKFIIAGDGPLKNKIIELINNYNLKDKIFLKGFLNREQLFEEYKNSNIFVLPSIWYENAPLSVIEAASKRLVLLVSGHGGIKEMAELCGGGIYFDPFKKESIISAINKAFDILKSPNNNEISKNSNFLSLFNPNKYIDDLIKIYEE